MTRTAVIVIEGVLQAYQGKAPIQAGILLYHGLKETFNLALVSDATDQEKIDYWLNLHGFSMHSYLFPALVTDPESPVERRMAQVGRIRQAGCSVDLMIEPDPQISAAGLRAGITMLNYLHPLYARPEYRPDYEGRLKPRAWDELMKETRRQERLKVADQRLAERSNE